ncbi:MAG: hypothetical protein LUE89_00110 [Clostridiales bacterium]|nr:hypothetical protein [Clostridiales bacterium]
MKKMLALLLALSMALALAACGGSAGDSASGGSTSSAAVADVSEQQTVEDTSGVVEQDTAGSSASMEGASVSGDVDLSTLGIVGVDVNDYVPGESLDGFYAHSLDDDVQDWVEQCESYIFSALDEDEETFPGFFCVSASNDYIACYIWSSDLPVSTYAYLAMQGDENSADVWSSFCDLMCALSSEADTWLAMKADDYHAMILLANDADTSRTLLAAYNGEIVYDVTTYDAEA